MSTPHPPDPSEPNGERRHETDPLRLRYQEANAHDPARPGDALRATVLAQAHAAAAASAKPASPKATSESNLRRTAHAANDSRWTWRAFGGLAVVGLAGLLFMQFERGDEDERDAALGAPSVSAPARKESAANPNTPSATGAPAAARPTPSKKPSAEPSAEPDTRAYNARARSAASNTRSAGLADPAPQASEDRNATSAHPLDRQSSSSETSAAAAPQPRPAPAPVPAQADMESEAAEAQQNQPQDQAEELAKGGGGGAPSRAAIHSKQHAQALEPPAESTPPGQTSDLAASGEARGAARAWFSAAEAGNVKALQAQLALGADANQRNAQGRSALMSAAARGHTEAVRALLQAGANPRLRDGQGNTALDLAGAPSQQQVPALLDLLRAAQAAP